MNMINEVPCFINLLFTAGKKKCRSSRSYLINMTEVNAFLHKFTILIFASFLKIKNQKEEHAGVII